MLIVLIVSIDDFLQMSTEDVIYEDDLFEISSKINDKILNMIEESHTLIVDHVITSQRILNQLKGTVDKYDFYKVKVTCPLEVLKKREERKNRCIGSAEGSYEYLFPKEGYDVEVDTFKLSSEECALIICIEIYLSE